MYLAKHQHGLCLVFKLQKGYDFKFHKDGVLYSTQLVISHFAMHMSRLILLRSQQEMSEANTLAF